MTSPVKKDIITLITNNNKSARKKEEDGDDFSVSELTSSMLELDANDPPEDRLFSSPSDNLLPHTTLEINRLRSTDPEIYQRVAVILKDIANIEVPFFILQILKLSHLEIEEKDPQRAIKLNFEIDNLIIRRLQIMHRARVLKRTKGFDLNLGKLMTVIYRHFYEGVKDVPEQLVNQLVPNWPDQIRSTLEKSIEPETTGSWNLLNESKLFLLDPVPEVLKLGTSISVPENVEAKKPFVPPFKLLEKIQEPFTFRPTSANETKSPRSTCLKKEAKISGALAYGLTFDIFCPDPKLFSVYLHPNLEYTSEPKDPPIDSDNRPTESLKSDASSRLWRQMKRSATRLTRRIRGNPRYFITPEDVHND